MLIIMLELIISILMFISSSLVLLFNDKKLKTYHTISIIITATIAATSFIMVPADIAEIIKLSVIGLLSISLAAIVAGEIKIAIKLNK